MAVYKGEPSFIDPGEFVDDIGDEQLLSDLLQGTPLEADGIDDSCVMVDNVPQVGPERLDKLKSVIHRIFIQFGEITTEFYPEADGMTKGYVFMKYATPGQALMAVRYLDGYKMDRRHTIRVTTFSGFDRKKPFKDVRNCPYPYSTVEYESGQKAAAVVSVAVVSNDATEPIPVEKRKAWRDTCTVS